MCADSEARLSYNLSYTESDSLWKHKYLSKGGRKYFSTDIRLEHYPVILYKLKQLQNRDTLVIFTHEWAIGNQTIIDFGSRLLHDRRIQINSLNRKNLEIAIKWLYDNDYKFTFLE